MKAAGILFLSANGNALFLRRGPAAPDCPGCWDFPGGGQEGDETSEETARREAKEEVGDFPDGDLVLHTRTLSAPGSSTGAAGLGAPPVLPVPAGAPTVLPITPGVDFTTFLQKVDEEFTPTLNDEHDGWAWAPIGAPPQPVHPGCAIALARIGMNELDVARAISDGRLVSPQRYENVWLFAIRITGTDVAFRDKVDEFVVRKPEHYLNEEFLARCNGLPVIFKHPPTALLNSEEFSNRVVGTVFLPYIAGSEVWAVAKIFVDAVAQMMREGNLSTSPGVNFADFSVNGKLTLEDGSKVLIEGKPSLFDHVAICELGVWDKGGDPAGIRSEAREDSAMSDEEKKAAEDKAKKDAAEAEQKAKDDAARKDAEEKAKADADAKAKTDADAGTSLEKTITDGMKSVADAVANLGKRMDAIEDLEKKRGDSAKKDDEDKETEAKRVAADKAKKDAAEDKEKEEKAKTDSADVRKRIEEVAALIPKSIGDADYTAMTDAQARADDIFSKFGKHAPRPLQGETPSLYERRVVRMLKEHSPTWKAAEVTAAFADDASFGIVRDQVYREASIAALSPMNVPNGELRMITKRSGGHEIHEFVGDPRSWMDPMAGATRQFVTGIRTPNNN